jgi:cell division protein FtsL
MNAAVRTLQQQRYIFGLIYMSKQQMTGLILLLLVLLSAMMVVYVRDGNRQLVGELQGLSHQSSRLLMERSRLLLERSALTTSARVQTIAEDELTMFMPPPDVVTMVYL